MAEIVPFAGFDRNLRLESGDAVLVATLEVGPRVLHFGREGRNLLKVSAKDEGRKGDGVYRSYGGHRLWIAPEDRERTYVPDSDAPTYVQEGDAHRFSRPADPYGIAKELAIRPLDEGGFALRHTLTNAGGSPVRVAPWGITVMAPGGECYVPHPPPVSHEDLLLPTRSLALWGYARMDDPRFTWGARAMRLRQDSNLGATKFGGFVPTGLAAYALGGDLFVKRFDADPLAIYPDMGCNFEAFTREDMLEVESLGPLRELPPGGAAVHDETWWLRAGTVLPDGEQALGDALDELARLCPHVGF